MADQKQGGIAWTDATFNPVRGCRKLSAGCAHCYAAELSRVNPGVLGTWGANGQRVISPDGWEARFDAWEKKAAKAGKPMRVFVNSMWDPGEGPDVNGKEGRDGPRAEYLPVLLKLVQIARRCPHLRLQMLTKRPWNLVAWWRKREWYMMDDATGKTVVWPANLWIGASTEDQASADERIPWLLQLPAAVRFLSVEPMLGPVDLAGWAIDAEGSYPLDRLAWVITGGESGTGARPIHPQWARDLRDQCAAAGVPFFFKQWGEWGPLSVSEFVNTAIAGHALREYDGDRWGDAEGGAWSMFRIGKNATGRTLDGKVWDEFPAEVTP